jgi:hypothetical protein
MSGVLASMLGAVGAVLRLFWGNLNSFTVMNSNGYIDLIFNANGTITTEGGPGALFIPSPVPPEWAAGSPITQGDQVEIQVEFTSWSQTGGIFSAAGFFAGVQYNAVATTPWYPLSANRTLRALADLGNNVSFDFTVRVRKIGEPGSVITRAGYLSAQRTSI